MIALGIIIIGGVIILILDIAATAVVEIASVGVLTLPVLVIDAAIIGADLSILLLLIGLDLLSGLRAHWLSIRLTILSLSLIHLQSHNQHRLPFCTLVIYPKAILPILPIRADEDIFLPKTVGDMSPNLQMEGGSLTIEVTFGSGLKTHMPDLTGMFSILSQKSIQMLVPRVTL